MKNMYTALFLVILITCFYTHCVLGQTTITTFSYLCPPLVPLLPSPTTTSNYDLRLPTSPDSIKCNWTQDVLDVLVQYRAVSTLSIFVPGGSRTTSLRSIACDQSAKNFGAVYETGMTQGSPAGDVTAVFAFDENRILLVSKVRHAVWTLIVGGTELITTSLFCGSPFVEGMEDNTQYAKLAEPRAALRYGRTVYITDTLNLRVRRVDVLNQVATTVLVGEPTLGIICFRNYLYVGKLTSSPLLIVKPIYGEMNFMASPWFQGPIYAITMDCSRRMIYVGEYETGAIRSISLTEMNGVSFPPLVAPGVLPVGIMGMSPSPEQAVLFIAINNPVTQTIVRGNLERKNCASLMCARLSPTCASTRTYTHNETTEHQSSTKTNSSTNVRLSTSATDTLTKSYIFHPPPVDTHSETIRQAKLLVLDLAALIGFVTTVVRTHIPGLSRIILASAQTTLCSLDPTDDTIINFRDTIAMHPTGINVNTPFFGAALVNLLITLGALGCGRIFGRLVKRFDVSGIGGVIMRYCFVPISMGAAHTLFYNPTWILKILSVGIIGGLCVLSYFTLTRGLIIPVVFRQIAARYDEVNVWFLTVDCILDLICGLLCGIDVPHTDAQACILQHTMLVVILIIQILGLIIKTPLFLKSHLYFEVGLNGLLIVISCMHMGIPGSSETTLIVMVFYILIYGYILLIGTKTQRPQYLTNTSTVPRFRGGDPQNENSPHSAQHSIDDDNVSAGSKTSKHSLKHKLSSLMVPREMTEREETQFMYDLLVPMQYGQFYNQENEEEEQQEGGNGSREGSQGSQAGEYSPTPLYIPSAYESTIPQVRPKQGKK